MATHGACACLTEISRDITADSRGIAEISRHTSQAVVKFGKIVSKDTWRDIMRFWRLLLLDMLPESPQILDLFTVYFEWVSLVLSTGFVGTPSAEISRAMRRDLTCRRA